jgi:hypothetical protein
MYNQRRDLSGRRLKPSNRLFKITVTRPKQHLQNYKDGYEQAMKRDEAVKRKEATHDETDKRRSLWKPHDMTESEEAHALQLKLNKTPR